VSLPRRLKADIALGIVSFIWGATFVVIKGALQDASPIVFVLLRFVLASLVLLGIFGRRSRLRALGLPWAGTVTGFFLCAGYVFQTVGLNYTTPAKSAFITALSVVLVPLVLVVVLRQRLRLWTLVGVGAAVAGLFFLTVPAGQFSMAPGDVITLVCAVAFAGHIVAVGHYAPRYGVGGLAIWQVGAALAFAAVALPVVSLAGLEAPRLNWTPGLALALVVTAVLATAVAFSVQIWAQQFTSATHTAVLYSMEPVFAALTSYVVLGERLNSRGLLGAGLILAGVLLAELWPKPRPDVPGMPAPANPSGEEAV
jgi:drug/metabolite transporter (DMT)-like permease